jgi:hypothetical protein
MHALLVQCVNACMPDQQQHPILQKPGAQKPELTPMVCSCTPLHPQAANRAPSIIFLDELDGLVPARASHTGHGGDQVPLPAC